MRKSREIKPANNMLELVGFVDKLNLRADNYLSPKTQSGSQLGTIIVVKYWRIRRVRVEYKSMRMPLGERWGQVTSLAPNHVHEQINIT